MALPRLDGIDVRAAVARLGMSFDAYRRLLLRFAGDGTSTAAAARQAVRAQDWKSAALHAHALAGAAGNLGAARLRELAKALEHSANTGGNDADAHLTSLEDEASRVFAAIETLRPAPTDVPEQAGARESADSATIGPLIARVQGALADGDPIASEEAITALAQAGAPVAWQADLARLRDLAERYEFEAAAAVADQLAARLRGTA